MVLNIDTQSSLQKRKPPQEYSENNYNELKNHSKSFIVMRNAINSHEIKFNSMGEVFHLASHCPKWKALHQ
jgi:hypothetical protein